MAQQPPEWTGPFRTEDEAEQVRQRLEAEHAEYLDEHEEVMMYVQHDADRFWVVPLRGSPGWGPIEVDDD